MKRLLCFVFLMFFLFLFHSFFLIFYKASDECNVIMGSLYCWEVLPCCLSLYTTFYLRKKKKKTYKQYRNGVSIFIFFVFVSLQKYLRTLFFSHLIVGLWFNNSKMFKSYLLFFSTVSPILACQCSVHDHNMQGYECTLLLIDVWNFVFLEDGELSTNWKLWLTAQMLWCFCESVDAFYNFEFEKKWE